MRAPRTIVPLLFLLSSLGCLADQQLSVGAERLSAYLPLLKQQRVALMVNQSSRLGDQHLVDRLLTEGVDIRAILAVEHGFRGKHGAGEVVESGKDAKTGIPIISLYGKQRTLLPDQVKAFDVLLYDLQDVGVRFYTYSRSLHDLLQSCQDHNKTLVVLDRPNPNGDYIAGPILEPEYRSSLSVDPLPLVHGLTMAEYARMVLAEGWLKPSGQCTLHTISMQNYDRNQQYSLPLRPSPNLPNDLSIRLYPSLALFEGTPVSVGRGTDWPFQVLGYPEPAMGDFEFRPKQIRGSWSQLNHAGKTLYGEQFEAPMRFSLDPFINWYQKFQKQEETFINRTNFFDKLAGTATLRQSILAGEDAQEIEQHWQNDLKEYQARRKHYLLYPESRWMKRNFP